MNPRVVTYITIISILLLWSLVLTSTRTHNKINNPDVVYELEDGCKVTINSDTSDIYAGRFDTIPSSSSDYTYYGKPVNRDWLTKDEWHCEHCDSKMKKYFKVWKRQEMDRFIDWMIDAAVDETRIYTDIPPELIVAQSILETNYGKSRLSVLANNRFGHKYYGDTPGEFLVAADDSPDDKFKKFKSPWWSIRAHSKLLMGKYRKRIKGKPNLKKWLHSLCGGMTLNESKRFVKRGGQTYATSCYSGSGCYSEKVKRVIDSYELTKRCKQRAKELESRKQKR